MRLHNLPALKTRRRLLRANLTPAEGRLWEALKNRRLRARKFRRQHSLGPYLLDFYCPVEKLAVELDGAEHDHARAWRHDRRRDEFLLRAGIRVLRFQNEDVVKNLEGVLFEIAAHFGPEA